VCCWTVKALMKVRMCCDEMEPEQTVKALMKVRMCCDEMVACAVGRWRH
jgi:hypothetical protein